MPFDPRNYMKLMFYTICLILVCSYLFAGEKILHSKIKAIQPEKTFLLISLYIVIYILFNQRYFNKVF